MESKIAHSKKRRPEPQDPQDAQRPAKRLCPNQVEEPAVNSGQRERSQPNSKNLHPTKRVASPIGLAVLEDENSIDIIELERLVGDDD